MPQCCLKGRCDSVLLQAVNSCNFQQAISWKRTFSNHLALDRVDSTGLSGSVHFLGDFLGKGPFLLKQAPSQTASKPRPVAMEIKPRKKTVRVFTRRIQASSRYNLISTEGDANKAEECSVDR